MKHQVYAVVGPTASGKTALSVALAKKLGGQIVSCDSMQVYKGLDIGTAKVTEKEKNGVIHHMIDIVSPTEDYSVWKYKETARNIIDDLISRGIPVIIAGGTGLYFDHLIADTQFVDVPTDVKLRKSLMEQPSDELFNKLREVDSVSADKLNINDKKRIVRALEIYLLTGKTVGYWNDLSHRGSSPLEAVIFGLKFADRGELYERINKRVDLMVQDGLVEEVQRLLSLDGFIASTAADAIGYKEIIQHLQNDCSFEDAIEQIKLNTRHYAKRQLTWFRRNPNIHWLTVHGNSTMEDMLLQVLQILERI